MSWIDSTLSEECITDASMDKLAKVLEQNKYEVIRMRLQITAKRGGFWTNGKISTITIIDKGDYRYCKDVETSKGWAMKPNSGVLARLVAIAESDI